MFILSEMQDIVAVVPHHFKNQLKETLHNSLNWRFANKVIVDLGLCVCLYDILHVGDMFILACDGRGHVPVRFRFIIFRPFVDEILEAKIVSSTEAGITLSVGFFEDIFIPMHKLPCPNGFEKTEQTWYWAYGQEEGEPPTKLMMEAGSTVRFRVVENIFKDVRPDPNDEPSKNEKSFQVIGQMMESGLGCLTWWNNEGEEDEEEEEDGEEQSANGEEDEDMSAE
ncbi:unnamed protein product, partial [Mesorhabditis spiculigera]